MCSIPQGKECSMHLLIVSGCQWGIVPADWKLSSISSLPGEQLLCAWVWVERRGTVDTVCRCQSRWRGAPREENVGDKGCVFLWVTIYQYWLCFLSFFLSPPISQSYFQHSAVLCDCDVSHTQLCSWNYSTNAGELVYHLCDQVDWSDQNLQET